MEGVYRATKGLRAFSVGILIGAIVMYAGILVVDAATGIIRPDGTGGSSQATQTTCGGAGNFDCLNEVVTRPTLPLAVDDFLTFNRNDTDFYTMGTLSGVSSVSQIDVQVYHIDDKNNMQLEVSLWDNTETVQYGGNVLLTYRSSASWDTASFSGLSLTSGQLDGLRVRLRCLRTGGGGASTCRAFALYNDVTYVERIDVTVGTTSSQQNLSIGTTSAHVGGAFTIVENTSTRNITSITLTENGTVDAANNLKNIKLVYDIDNSAPYDCATNTYNGNEPQFGSTDADGFSAANGTSVFTGTTSISTTQAMCVYPVLDVLSTAGIGETIELQITNPNTEVSGSGSPNIQPTTTRALGGTTVLTKEDVQVTDFHWRNDDGNETGATSATAGSASTDIAAGSKATNYRLRYAVSNEGNQTATAKQFRIEYGTRVTTCAEVGSWFDVGAVGGDWDMAGAGSGLTEGSNTTDITLGSGGITPNPNSNFLGTNGGQKETSSQTGSLVLTSTDFVELEYALVSSGAAADGTTYCFRLTDAGATTTVANTVYPQFTIAADITVGVSGSQVSTVTIPTADFYVGGQYAITDGTPATTHTISSVTIAASSTLDATTDLNNIQLFYDLDRSSPYDCATNTFNGDELQFGSTDTDGFSAAGTSTFTGSVIANTTQAVCFYVELDVLSSAANGEQFEIRINDPSADIVTSSGSVAPAGLLDITGETTVLSPIVVQGNYHWRNNDGDEAGATSATGGSENTVYNDFPQLITERLRFDVSNIGGSASGNYQYQLQWAQKFGSCSTVPDENWFDVDVANDEFAVVTSLLVDGANTTDLLEADGGVNNQANTFLTANGGQEDSSSQTGNINLAADEYAELEYSIQATASTTEGASYCFRLTNAGTKLDNYLQYPELNIKLGTDFVVTRNVTTILNGASTASISNGNEYTLQTGSSSRAFIRITNNANTGAGPAATGNNLASNVTAYISNPGNIASGITFTRAGTAGATRIAWEVVEYIGDSGGENEIIVRNHGVATYGTAATTVTTATVAGIVDDTDVVPMITGQGNPDTTRFDYNTTLSTSAWNAGADTATFTRGEANGDAVNVSYAIIEFVGANWKIQRDEYTYTAAGAPTTTNNISPVVSITKAFLHVQKRVGAGEDQHAEFGHQVYLSGVGSITYQIDGNARTPSLHTSVAWIIENTQTQGAVMKVKQSAGSIGSVSVPQIENKDIGVTLTDITIASIFVHGGSNGASRTFHEPMFSARLLNSSTTQYELWLGDSSEGAFYQTEVVQWPTASAKVAQNYFQFYVDNSSTTSPTPTDIWPPGPAAMAENAEMTPSDGPVATGETIRIRLNLLVSAATLISGADSFVLQYAEKPEATVCSAILDSSWHRLGDSSSTTTLWRGTSTPVTDGVTLPSVLLSNSDVAGTYEEENPSAVTPQNTLVGQNIEYDWNIQNNGAADKTDYCFRVTYSDGTPTETPINYPVIRTVGYEPELGDWRWFDDETSLTPTVSLAATNSAPFDIANDNIIKLRAVVKEVSGATGENAKFKLQYSQFANFSSVFDVVATSTCTATSTWCYADGNGVDNATITATTIATADSCSGGVGVGCGTHNEGTSSSTATLDHQALTNAEFEFTIKHAGARVGTVYYFRLFDQQNNLVVAASSSNPSVLTESGTLVFSLEGVGSGQTTEGITTDVTTTPTSIPFGSVPVDTEFEAAYRLTMDTNATEGYQMFMYATQEMTNTYGDAILPISGTNAAPVAWATGCTGGSPSCIGYHVGDDSLSDGSTRFSPNNTYARFSTSTLEEVMYSGQPSVSESTDIIFKIQVSNQQPAGDYQKDIVFISVPIF